MRSVTFRDMRSAPQDGTLIEVRHGTQQETVVAHWASQNQAFVRNDDPNRTTLTWVTGWRPVKSNTSRRIVVTR